MFQIQHNKEVYMTQIMDFSWCYIGCPTSLLNMILLFCEQTQLTNDVKALDIIL